MENAMNKSKSSAFSQSKCFFILDTGGWTVKHGLCIVGPEADDSATTNNINNISSSSSSSKVNSHSSPNSTPNATAQLPHQITTWVGNDLESCVKNQSLLRISRPFDRGYIMDFQTQLLVWEYIFAQYALNCNHSLATREISALARSNKVISKTLHSNIRIENKHISTHQSTIVLLSKPFVPTCLMEHEDEIFFKNFGFRQVIRRLSASCAAFRFLHMDHALSNNNNQSLPSTLSWEKDSTGCCCVIESGFSLTHIVPTVHTWAIEKAIRRIHIGGKHLTNVLKEVISYRHWNMMDEFTIVNQIKEDLCFLSEHGKIELLLQYAKTKPLGSRWFDRDYVLPDFVHTFKGTVQLPKALGTNRNEESILNEQEDMDMERPPKQEMSVDDNSKQNKDDSSHSEESDNEDIDSEDESEEAKRIRIIEQKEQEKKRLQAQLEEQQVLPMSVERFTVPEILFRPTDIGLNHFGLAEAIVQSIQACDPIFHAAMYHNIVLTGGNMLLPNMKQRLEVELRALVPSQYKVRIYLPEDPIAYAWEGAREWAISGTMEKNLCLDRVQWEETRKLHKDWASLWKNTSTKTMSTQGYIWI